MANVLNPLLVTLPVKLPTNPVVAVTVVPRIVVAVVAPIIVLSILPLLTSILANVLNPLLVTLPIRSPMNTVLAVIVLADTSPSNSMLPLPIISKLLRSKLPPN